MTTNLHTVDVIAGDGIGPEPPQGVVSRACQPPWSRSPQLRISVLPVSPAS